VRGDDRLGLERDGGRGDPQDRAEGLQELVDLGRFWQFVPTPLPQERHRVEPQDVDARPASRA
jgi:hypothetical protein